MSYFKMTIIGLGLVALTMTASDAEAGKYKKPAKGSRTEKTEEMSIARRFDNYPDMEFHGGIITRDAHAGWKIGEFPLYLNKDCVITMDGEVDGWLEEGREAVVMGARMGGAITAYAVHVSQPEFASVGTSASEELKESGPNRNVSKIVQPVE